MTQDQIAELRERLAKEITDARDSMVAEGDDIIWLFCQLVHWPHERVHSERTMSDPFIRVSAARTALALLDRIEKLEAGLRPFADAAEDWDYGDGSGPDTADYPDASSLPEINPLTIGDLRRARILSETPHAE